MNLQEIGNRIKELKLKDNKEGLSKEEKDELVRLTYKVLAVMFG